MVAFTEMREEYLAEVLEIYNYYVLHSTATFHIKPLTLEEMGDLVFFPDPRHRTFVILEDGAIIGYVYLGPHKTRPAYGQTGEITVYLRHDYIGSGVGSMAVRFIEDYARDKEFHVLVASMCGENDKSMGVFVRNGFAKAMHFREIGYKFGRWLDVAGYQKILK